MYSKINDGEQRILYSHGCKLNMELVATRVYFLTIDTLSLFSGVCVRLKIEIKNEKKNEKRKKEVKIARKSLLFYKNVQTSENISDRWCHKCHICKLHKVEFKSIRSII